MIEEAPETLEPGLKSTDFIANEEYISLSRRYGVPFQDIKEKERDKLFVYIMTTPCEVTGEYIISFFVRRYFLNRFFSC